ncbi:MAG: hypothetical protein ACE5EX_01005 [Phycisphaerae bacterium]
MSTIGTGGDFTSITSWLNSLPGTLTEIETGECKAEAFVENVTINNSITAVDKYILLTASATARHDGRANAVSGAGNARVDAGTTKSKKSISISDDHCRVEWLEWLNAGGGPKAATHAFEILGQTAADAVEHINANIIHNDEQSSRNGNVAIRPTDPDADLECYRNIVYGMGGSMFRNTDNSGHTNFYNNTGWKNNKSGDVLVKGVWSSLVNTTIKNNVSFDTSGADDYLITNATTSNNASTDATGDTGLINLTATEELVNPSSLGFPNWSQTDLLQKSGATLNDAGTALGAPYDVDITGDTVTGTWDVGADEVAGGGGVAVLRRRREGY